MTEQVAENTNIALDDHVDGEIASCLNLEAPRSFFLFAGAGSGKTRSLVNALDYIAETHSVRLGMRGQKVGVVTYTNAACDEIVRRVKSNRLFHVSTIHSFVWDLISGLDFDIREWLRRDLASDIEDLVAQEAKGRAGTKASITRQASIDSKRRRLAALDEIRKFTYNPTGDNRERNSLNHAEVIQICASFLSKPLMQRILVNEYPFLLIDESQDTNKELIDALLRVEAAHRAHFCLGLIGDIMQRIYSDGKDGIERELPEEWLKPEKRLNHRCPKRLVRLINHVRSEVDEHVQEPRSDSIEGFVRLFVLPSDSTADKSTVEEAARAHMAEATGDRGWNNRDDCKILALEHHMAAKRMGFQNIFDPLYAVERFRTSLLDGTLPAVRFFTQDILKLVTAQQENDQFATARVVRERSPMLSKLALKNAAQPQEQLRLARDAVGSLMALWSQGEPTCGAILENVAASGLFLIPDSLRPVLELRRAAQVANGVEADSTDSPPEVVALEAFLESPFSQVLPFEQYVSSVAPFDTHQGVKGREFDRVMVLMDDSEARGFMFGYEKLLGAKEQTATDIANETAGKETTLDRTRRLFYVTSSRAKRSLALVAYSANPEAIKSRVLEDGWFDEDEVVLAV